mmetsp:Transcript_81937/g.163164  ORF Transcript_81937/g.163164 Transcript_81937/m.163164 type:complete len:224 (-) Transcript_81937:1389-2060(-)
MHTILEIRRLYLEDAAIARAIPAPQSYPTTTHERACKAASSLSTTTAGPPGSHTCSERVGIRPVAGGGVWPWPGMSGQTTWYPACTKAGASQHMASALDGLPCNARASPSGALAASPYARQEMPPMLHRPPGQLGSPGRTPAHGRSLAATCAAWKSATLRFAASALASAPAHGRWRGTCRAATRASPLRKRRQAAAKLQVACVWLACCTGMAHEQGRAVRGER